MIQLKDITLLKDNKSVNFDINIIEGHVYILEGLPIESLKALYGILEGRLLPASGDYLFEGRSLNDFSKLERASLRKHRIINLLDPTFFDDSFTITKNLQQQLKKSGIYPTKWKAIISRILTELDIQHLGDKAASGLDPLQLIKAKIAKAAVVAPKVILMANAFQHLQMHEKEIIEDILITMQKKGITIINAETFCINCNNDFIRIWIS